MDQNNPPAPRRTLSNDFFLLFIIVAVVMISGYLIGNQVPLLTRNETAPPYSPPQVTYQIGPPAIVRSQQATAVGTITGTDGKYIIVEAGAVKARFKVADNFSILKQASSSAKIATPAAELVHSTYMRDILTNKQAVISLELLGNDYQVTNISYPVLTP